MDYDKTKIIFWIAFLVGFIAFFCPFTARASGVEIYIEVFYDLFFSNRGLNGEELWIILPLMICILLWLPLMGYAYYRYMVKERHYTIKQKSINVFLFGVGSSIYILPIYIMYDSGGIHVLSWGYWLLLVCMSILFVCYVLLQKERLMDDGDLTKHLIDDEND